MHLDSGKRVNSRSQHLSQLKGQYHRGERWHAGAMLVSILWKLIDSKANARTEGIPALRMGGLTRQMWVVKKPVGHLRKGQKILRKAAMEHYEQQGATFRPIRFPKDKDIKDALAQMAKVLGSFHHEVQYGFVPKRDCVKSAAQHANARVVYLLDLEAAFHQVTENQVSQILRQVFLVNKRDADLIAELSCHGGVLYQGNPLAPVLFNLRAVWLAHRLHKLCNATGCRVTMYADDLTISTENWNYFSSGFRKTVRRIIRECGFKVNSTKCKVAKVSPYKVGHYDITGLTVDYDETGLPKVRPLHRRKTRKKAAYLQRTSAKGAEFTNELDKNGNYKQLSCVIAGLENWAKREGEPGDYPQLTLALLGST